MKGQFRVRRIRRQFRTIEKAVKKGVKPGKAALKAAVEPGKDADELGNLV